MAILIDASVFCAYANFRDVHHKNSIKLMRDIVSQKYGRSVTTDYIFDETVNVVARKHNKKSAIETGEHILNSEIFFAKVDESVFKKAWRLFQDENNFSFTDCTTIAFMGIFGIDKITTFDKEFKKLNNIKVID